MKVPANLASLFIEAGNIYGVDAALIAAISYVESKWNPNALGDFDSQGRPHSFGLMQLYDKGAGAGYTREQLLDPRTNVMLGTKYLKQCIDAFPGDIETAISAYNQGIANARRRGKQANYYYVQLVLKAWNNIKAEGFTTTTEPSFEQRQAQNLPRQWGATGGMICQSHTESYGLKIPWT